jgi:hypothetical protein
MKMKEFTQSEKLTEGKKEHTQRCVKRNSKNHKKEASKANGGSSGSELNLNDLVLIIKLLLKNVRKHDRRDMTRQQTKERCTIGSKEQEEQEEQEEGTQDACVGKFEY